VALLTFKFFCNRKQEQKNMFNLEVTIISIGLATEISSLENIMVIYAAQAFGYFEDL
jgi:hypothetical protein